MASVTTDAMPKQKTVGKIANGFLNFRSSYLMTGWTLFLRRMRRVLTPNGINSNAAAATVEGSGTAVRGQ